MEGCPWKQSSRPPDARRATCWTADMDRIPDGPEEAVAPVPAFPRRASLRPERTVP
ncbi:hypothetical protein GCM10022416_06730 [Actinomadura keratinilytica]|uniref:Uncharacterized protein n=1 Tax=Actinomadura keratinilytica TaxID=547461 RepID=A0ABP7Y2R1_9ACTN